MTDIEPSTIGVWYIVDDSWHPTGRTILAETRDENEFIERWTAVYGRAPDRYYFEGTLDEALSHLEQDGIAQLAE